MGNKWPGTAKNTFAIAVLVILFCADANATYMEHIWVVRIGSHAFGLVGYTNSLPPLVFTEVYCGTSVASFDYLLRVNQPIHFVAFALAVIINIPVATAAIYFRR